VSGVQSDTVLIERAAGVVTVTMNRPERKNAVNGEMWVALRAAFEDISRRIEDRVVVVTGAGGAFCSGADLTDPRGIGGGEPDEPYLLRMRRVSDVILALHRIPQPTIAKVDGVAVGAGLSLALACDLVVASHTARFSEIFTRRGLSVDGGSSWLLPRLVGLQRAKELTFFGEMLSAPDAAEVGIVNRVLPAEELDSFVDDWAHRLAVGPTQAISLTKGMLNNSFAVSLEQALEDEARSQTINFASVDTAEAMSAFAEKREPEFRGY
jgi:2-(1,2-epoxy-1,2-dihydrophenyl)acetyl-CoA isomerase